MKKHTALLLIGLLFLTSCLAPPEGTEEMNLLTLIEEQLMALNAVNDDKEAQLQYFKDMFTGTKMVVTFEKDSSIIMQSMQTEPQADDFMYSSDNNVFIVSKPLYVTGYKDRMIYSLDNETWYTTRNDPIQEIHSLENNYYFETIRENNTLIIKYTMRFSPGEIPEIVKLRKKREVISLDNGLVIAHDDDTLINVDLDNQILLLPVGTRVSGTMQMTGNVLTSSTDDTGLVTINAMRSIYIYIRRMIPSLSFDKQKWNVSPLSFKVDSTFEMKSIADDHIYFYMATDLDYNVKRKSFSVLQMLIEMM